MLLSDCQIRGRAEDADLIAPFRPSQLQPASYDVLLAPELRVFDDLAIGDEVDVRDVPEGHTKQVTMGDSGYLLRPGEFVLGCTVEELKLPGDLAATVEGKSSLGRLGLAVHVTAGFIDPGFRGQVTLEIVNLLHRSIRLRPGMPIGQIAFMQMSRCPSRLYGRAGNRYQGQLGPTESRYRM